jgi:hypothetical protein
VDGPAANRDTVRSEIEMPGILSSPWMRGARHSGLAVNICSINRRISGRSVADQSGVDAP